MTLSEKGHEPQAFSQLSMALNECHWLFLLHPSGGGMITRRPTKSLGSFGEILYEYIIVITILIMIMMIIVIIIMITIMIIIIIIMRTKNKNI